MKSIKKESTVQINYLSDLTPDYVGNEIPDIDFAIWESEYEEFLNKLEECGKQTFIFSARPSSYIETFAFLMRNGWKLKEDVEIIIEKYNDAEQAQIVRMWGEERAADYEKRFRYETKLGLEFVKE